MKTIKPQTEQQQLARKEGRALGAVGMCQAQYTELMRMGFITAVEANELYCRAQLIKYRILDQMKARMKAAGTYKERSYDFSDI